jgi:hypothetical protein
MRKEPPAPTKQEAEWGLKMARRSGEEKKYFPPNRNWTMIHYLASPHPSNYADWLSMLPENTATLYITLYITNQPSP